MPSTTFCTCTVHNVVEDIKLRGYHVISTKFDVQNVVEGIKFYKRFEIGVQQWTVVGGTSVFHVRYLQQKRSPPSAQRLPFLQYLRGICTNIPQTCRSCNNCTSIPSDTKSKAARTKHLLKIASSNDECDTIAKKKKKWSKPNWNSNPNADLQCWLGHSEHKSRWKRPK